MGGSSSHEETTITNEQNTQITSNTTFNDNTTINENNFNIFTISKGQVDNELAVAYKKALETNEECLKAIEPVKNDAQQVLTKRKEHIRRYIEEALLCGVPIDDMIHGYKQFNSRNKWNLDPNLFNQVYAEYFSEPHKKVAELEQKVISLEQRIAVLVQSLSQLQAPEAQQTQEVQQIPQAEQTQEVQQAQQAQAAQQAEQTQEVQQAQQALEAQQAQQALEAQLAQQAPQAQQTQEAQQAQQALEAQQAQKAPQAQQTQEAQQA